MQFFLAKSQYWNVMENIDSSKLWQFIPSGNQSQSNFIAINNQHCVNSCQQKTDTWISQKFQNPISLTKNRIFVQEGIDSEFVIENEFTDNENNSHTICLIIERVGNTDSVTTTVSSQGKDEFQNIIPQGSGFIEDCFTFVNYQLSMQIDYSIAWGDSTTSQRWINPTGLSGRGDIVIDQSGLLLHWIELV
jgi:hypothetical protein